MRIAFFLRPAQREEPAPPDADLAPHVTEVTAEIIARLRDAGARVDLVVPENTAWDVERLATTAPDYDLYVLKSATPLSLSLAGVLAAAGAQIVNTFQPVRFRDKIVSTALLAAAGVPVPPSWAVGRVATLRSLLGEGPLLVKPPVGSMGRGIDRVDGPAGLEGEEGEALRRTFRDAQGRARPLFVQREVPSSGQDLKIYVAGDWVGAITRPFPAVTPEEKQGTPATVPPEIRQAAVACGRALQLELYGVDVLASDGRFFVVDVNSFPSYRGVADAPGRLAGYLRQRARRG